MEKIARVGLPNIKPMMAPTAGSALANESPKELENLLPPIIAPILTVSNINT